MVAPWQYDKNTMWVGVLKEIKVESWYGKMGVEGFEDLGVSGMLGIEMELEFDVKILVG